MNRRVLSAVAALALAAVGTFALVAFVRGAEDRAIAGEELVDVLVVQERVQAGTPAGELDGRVASEEVPAKVQAEDAVVGLGALGDRVAAVDLLPGEQVTAARFEQASAFERRRAQVEVPEDLLEVTVSLSPDRAVGGVVRPGSRVAVVASFDPFDVSSTEPVQLEGLQIPNEGKTPNSSHVILHKVLVTNVQTDSSFEAEQPEGDRTAPAPGGNLLVTLAVDTPSVERVVFAAEHGRVWLAVQPDAASENGAQVVTRGNVYR